MILLHRRKASRRSLLFFLFLLFLTVEAYARDRHAFLAVASEKNVTLPSSKTGFSPKPEVFNPNSSTSDEPRSSSFLVQAMQEQIRLAKIIAGVGRLNRRPRLLRELQFQIRENERALGTSVVDAELPDSAFKKMEALKQVLSRATYRHGRCENMAKRLRSSVMLSEDKVLQLKEENNALGGLAARTLPKGLHCLALQLTIQYYNEGGQPIVQDTSMLDSSGPMQHYAIYTENILAATAVINSTVHSTKEPHQQVFHVLTDDINHAAFQTWFQKNTPQKASVEIKNLENFHELHLPFSSQNKSRSYLKLPRLKAQLRQEKNFLTQKRLYLYYSLPRIFPKLEKVLVLDDDVVVQKDLSHLWEEDLHEKVMGAVGSCETSSDLGGMLGWACMNMLDLGEWRRQGLSEMLALDMGIWDLLTMIRESKTHVINETTCHVIDLGDTPFEWVNSTRNAAAIHYKGYAKPWLGVDMNMQYRDLWARFVNYENPLLRECNVHK